MPTPKKPTALHVLNGNPSKLKDLGKNEPKPTPIRPECPEWLNKEAKDKWKELAPQLEQLGLLTKIDGDEFARYCQFTVRAKQAEENVEKNGVLVNGAVPGTMVKNPAVQIARDYAQAASRLADKFGLSPSARNGLEVVEKEISEDKASFLSR